MTAKREEPAVVYTLPEAIAALSGEPRVALDLETSGFSPWRDAVHVVALYGAESNTIAVLHYPRGSPLPQELIEWLGERPELVAHNGVQFDFLFLANAGLEWRRPALFDTMIAEQAVTIADRKDISASLAAAVKRQLGGEVDKSIEHGRWGQPELDEDQLRYVTGDITYLLALREAQLAKADQLREDGRVRYPGMRSCIEFEMELAKPVIQMQLNGLTIDRGAVEGYLQEMRARDEELEPRLHAALDCTAEEVDALVRRLDPGLMELIEAVPAERLAAAITERGGCAIPTPMATALARIRSGTTLLSGHEQLMAALAVRYGPGRFPNTSKDTLMLFMQMGGDVEKMCEDLLRWRQLSKREAMFRPDWFLEHAIPTGGRDAIHGHFWQLRTNTGRFASSEPNMQQVPKDMRHCFGNREGWAFGRSDYSGIELRVMAAMANDEDMIAAFAAGEDIHATVVGAAFGKAVEEVTPPERRLGKAMNFTLTFGGSWQTFYDYAHVNGAALSRDEAQEMFETMLRRFSGVARLRQEAKEVIDRGRPITLVFPTGLRRQLAPWMPGYKDTTLLNNAVQAAAAAGLKYGVMEAWEAGLGDYLVAVVHDEIAYEAPAWMIEEVRAEVDQAMLRGMRRALMQLSPVMLGVESSYGPTWRENPATLRETGGMSQ